MQEAVRFNYLGGLVIMQSLIERANNGSHFGIQDKKHYWRYDWHTPTHSDSNATNPSNLNTEENHLGDSNLVEKYSFKYKTWLQVEKSIFDDELRRSDGLDVLNLSICSAKESGTSNSKIGSNPEAANTNDDNLTVEDIRGAVGNSESIPGFSTSDATTKNDDLNNEESQAIPKEDVVEDIAKDSHTATSELSDKSETKLKTSESHTDQEQEQEVNIDMDKKEHLNEPSTEASEAGERIQNVEKDTDEDINME